MPRRKRRAAPARGRRGRRPRAGRTPQALASPSAVQSLRTCRTELEAQCRTLAAQIAAVDRALQALTGAAAPRGTAPGRPPAGRRPRGAKGFRAGSLKEHIANVLGGGGTMQVKDIAAGVLEAGYRTANKTLAKSVGIALTEMPNVRKVGRGRFRLK